VTAVKCHSRTDDINIQQRMTTKLEPMQSNSVLTNDYSIETCYTVHTNHITENNKT